MSQPEPHRIVILEKDQNRRDYFKSIVSARGCVPFIFEKETNCFDNLRPLQPDLVISGPLSAYRMQRFVNTIKMMDSGMPLLIISEDQSMDDFAACHGFSDVKVLKVNFDSAEIKTVITKLLHTRSKITDNGNREYPLIIGNSPEIKQIKKKILGIKHLKEPILIQGEPGTGKELIARAIHYISQEQNAPFVKVQMAEVNPKQLDVINPGMKFNVISGSSSSCFQTEILKDGGTLFLDEVSALPLEGQSRLLAVFEGNAFPNASKNATPINGFGAALVVASGSILDKLVEEGKFRKDLYYRMNVVSIEIPPLRKRVSDIPLLADFFADKFCIEYGSCHIELSKKIKESFCHYFWPGNVRELKSIVNRIVLYGESDSVFQNLVAYGAKQIDFSRSEEDIYAVAGLSNLKKHLQHRDNLSLKGVCSVYLLRAEKAVIKKALNSTNWNRKKAAKLLEISYKSLLNKIKEYELA